MTTIDVEYLDRVPSGKRQLTASYNNPASTADEGNGCVSSCFGVLMFALSILLIIVTFPVSMIFCVRIVQEYERAVIFRLGRVRRNGTVGPGMFFIIPCLDQVLKCSKISGDLL